MFSEMLKKLRTKAHLTQAEIAVCVGVTRQTVQKWENGEEFPDAAKLCSLSRLFGTSLDALKNDDNLRTATPPQPKYDSINEWEAYYATLPLELRQCTEEGLDVRRIKPLVREIDRLASDRHKKKLADTIYDMISESPRISGYKYIEPSEYALILPLTKPQRLDCGLSDEELLRRINGAWTGRICGCVLGKPIEGMKRGELIEFLSENGNYPIHRYVNLSEVTPEVRKKYTYGFWGTGFGDTLDGAPSDDDTNYTILSSRLIDKCGLDFTSADVALLWVESQVKDAYCTAERVAYLNIINGYAPPDTAVRRNPYREWIGAQIRADYYGYINPGDPQTAAEMAFRDASVSHTKNGIYGAMLVAGMLASAYVLPDIPSVIQAGLDCIPHTSRLHEYITSVLKLYSSGAGYDDFVDMLTRDFDDRDAHNWCHTVSNAAIVCASLLFGGGDYSKTVSLAVSTGFDTDCNGATAGSVLGMMKGAEIIDSHWTAPIKGEIDTTIFGMSRMKISTLAQKTLSHIKLKK